MTTKRKAVSFSKSTPPRRSAPATRQCLSGIGKPHTFTSDGPANRVCAKCRRQVDDRVRGLGKTLLHQMPGRPPN